MVMSERMVKELNLEPIARLVSYAAAGVEPKNHGYRPGGSRAKGFETGGAQ